MIADSDVFFANHKDPETKRRGLALVDLVRALQEVLFFRKVALRRPLPVSEGRKLSPADHFLHDQIFDALNQAGGNKTLAAKKIGITRATIHKRMKRLGINLTILIVLALTGCATAPRRTLPIPPLLPVLQIHQGYGRTMPMLVAPSPKVVALHGITLTVVLVPTNAVALTASQLTPGHAYRLQQGHLHGTNWMDTSNFLALTDTWCSTQAIQIASGPAPFPGPLSQLDTNPPSRFTRSPSSVAKVFRLKDITP